MLHIKKFALENRIVKLDSENRYFDTTLQIVFDFVLDERLRKLISARRVIAAFDAFSGFDNLVDVSAFYETGNALKIAAATADEFDVCDFAVFYAEKDFSATSAFVVINCHFSSPFLIHK